MSLQGYPTRSGPGRRSFAASATIHVLAIALAWFSQRARPEPIQFLAYEIELVSPPPAERGEPTPAPPEEVVIERPEPQRQPEPETTPPPPPPEPQPERREEPPPEERPRPEPRREPPPPRETPRETPTPPRDPDPEPRTEGGEGINVRMEGLRRDYPAYYDNIIRQIYRCFRWRRPGNLEAVVRFTINRDGTVSDLQVVRRSGNVEFDFEAMGAVECAGSQERFGPLPDDLPFDRLPIEFSFRPAGN